MTFFGTFLFQGWECQRYIMQAAGEEKEKREAEECQAIMTFLGIILLQGSNNAGCEGEGIRSERRRNIEPERRFLVSFGCNALRFFKQAAR
jgi:hypothetical protein